MKEDASEGRDSVVQGGLDCMSTAPYCLPAELLIIGEKRIRQLGRGSPGPDILFGSETPILRVKTEGQHETLIKIPSRHVCSKFLFDGRALTKIRFDHLCQDTWLAECCLAHPEGDFIRQARTQVLF